MHQLQDVPDPRIISGKNMMGNTSILLIVNPAACTALMESTNPLGRIESK